MHFDQLPIYNPPNLFLHPYPPSLASRKIKIREKNPHQKIEKEEANKIQRKLAQDQTVWV
jgi:hypothetical protein